jgi:hypothetical protein
MLALENHQMNTNIDKLQEKERQKRIAEADIAATSAFALIKPTDAHSVRVSSHELVSLTSQISEELDRV